MTVLKLLPLLFLLGCDTIQASNSCKPIWISAGDILTDPTAKQILTHNETIEKLND